jgi:hypothetical protein
MNLRFGCSATTNRNDPGSTSLSRQAGNIAFLTRWGDTNWIAHDMGTRRIDDAPVRDDGSQIQTIP